MLKPTARDVLCGVGAVISGALGVSVLLGVVRGLVYFATEVKGTGSGGLGAVSAGISEGLVESLPLVASVIINRLVAARARRAGGALLTLHRAHSMSLLALPIVLAAVVLVATHAELSLRATLVLLFCLPLLFGVQFLLLSAVLVLCAIPRTRGLTA